MSSRITALYASVQLDTSTLAAASGKVRSAMGMVREAMTKTRTPAEMLAQDLERLALVQNKGKVTADEVAKTLQFLADKYDVEGKKAKAAAEQIAKEAQENERLLAAKKQAAAQAEKVARDRQIAAAQATAQERQRKQAMAQSMAQQQQMASLQQTVIGITKNQNVTEQQVIAALLKVREARRNATVGGQQYANMQSKLIAVLQQVRKAEADAIQQLATKKAADAAAAAQAQKNARDRQIAAAQLTAQERQRKQAMAQSMAQQQQIVSLQKTVISITKNQNVTEQQVIAALLQVREARRNATVGTQQYANMQTKLIAVLQQVRKAEADAAQQLAAKKAADAAAAAQAQKNARDRQNAAAQAAAQERQRKQAMAQSMAQQKEFNSLQKAVIALTKSETATEQQLQAVMLQVMQARRTATTGLARYNQMLQQLIAQLQKVRAAEAELARTQTASYQRNQRANQFAIDKVRELRAANSQLRKEHSMLRLAFREGTISATQYGAALRNVAMKSLSARLESIGLSRGIQTAAMAFISFQTVKATIQAAAEFEQLSMTMKVLIGDAEEAKKVFADINTLVETTPVTMRGAMDASRTLLAFGVAAEDLASTLEMLGNISAGNEERFLGLALAFAQTQAAGRLTGQEVLQMVNQGFNPLKQMAEDIEREFGIRAPVAFRKLKVAMEQGQISADMVTDAFRSASTGSGKYAGMLAAATETMSGQFAIFLSSVFQLKAQLGGVFTNVIVTLLTGLNKAIGAMNIMLKGMNEQAKAWIGWTLAISLFLLLIPRIVAGIKIIIGVLRLLTIAQVTALSLSGPQGWAFIAIGLGVAAAAAAAATVVFKGLSDQIADLENSFASGPSSGYAANLAELMKTAGKENITEEESASNLLEITKQLVQFGKTQNEIEQERLATTKQITLEKMKELALKGLAAATDEEAMAIAEQIVQLNNEYLAIEQNIQETQKKRNELELLKQASEAKTRDLEIQKQIADLGKTEAQLYKEELDALVKKGALQQQEADVYMKNFEQHQKAVEQERIANFHAQRRKDALQSTLDLAIARAANLITELEYQERLAAIEDKRLQTTKQLAEQGRGIKERYDPGLALERQIADLEVLYQTGSINVIEFIQEQNRILAEAADAKFGGMQQPSAMEFGSKEFADMMQQGAFDAQKQQLIEMEKQRLLQQAQLGAQQEANRLLNNIQTIGVARP